MRVSNRFLYYQLVKDIDSNTEKLFKLSNQISSGKRIERPSDDPVGMANVLIYRSDLNAFGQFTRTIDMANGWLSRTDAILQDVDDLLGRALELATSQASASATADTRNGAADEVAEIKNQIISLANSKYGSKFMFGGTQTQQSPFLNVTSLDESVATMSSSAPGSPSNGERYINTTDNHIYEYNGSTWQDMGLVDNGTGVVVDDQNTLYVYDSSSNDWVKEYRGNQTSFYVKIGKTDTLEINLAGDSVFRSSQGDVIMSLLNLEKALRDNDADAIRAQIGNLNDSEQVVLNNLATVGARVNRLDHTKSVLAKADADTKERVSDIEDLDYADAITSLQNQQTIYQATLKSASMITQLSLADYI